ncbi:hypothetical protein BDR03DRAFT_1017785 [Suillus americanus]|nr:hypothetical protein BDR03DRAFT_1017785 [Suillus americanus]
MQGLELAKTLLCRENLKRDYTQQTLQVWDKHFEFAELKRKFPSLGTNCYCEHKHGLKRRQRQRAVLQLPHDRNPSREKMKKARPFAMHEFSFIGFLHSAADVMYTDVACTPRNTFSEDEELLFDKERVAKKPKIEPNCIAGLKIHARDSRDLGSPAVVVEGSIRPQEHLRLINATMEHDLTSQTECDHGYEDVVENAYQRPTFPFPRRHWKAIFSSLRLSTPSPNIADG